MVGSALAKMVLSSEPMKTGRSTPSTIRRVSRCERSRTLADWVFASMRPPASALSGLGVLNCLPDGEGCRGHGDVTHAEFAQCVDDGADDDRKRGRGAAF